MKTKKYKQALLAKQSLKKPKGRLYTSYLLGVMNRVLNKFSVSKGETNKKILKNYEYHNEKLES